MSHFHALKVLVFSFFIFEWPCFADGTLLKVGDKAPAFATGEWLQGTPITSFQPGHFYIVEFWGTRCGPCVAGIPHLNEIQNRFKDKLTLIAVAAQEEAEDHSGKVQTVKKFMESHPTKMEYSVVVDDKDGRLFNDWMKASGEKAIPRAFVVDGTGKIVYIAHPIYLSSGIEEAEGPLQSMLSGTWMGSEDQLLLENERIETVLGFEETYALLDKIEKAQENQEWPLILKLYDEAMAYPHLLKNSKPSFQLARTAAVIKMEKFDQAVSDIQAFIHADYDQPFYSAELLGLFLEMPQPLTGKMLELGNKLASRTIELTLNHPNLSYREKYAYVSWRFLQAPAGFYHFTGQLDLAIQYQQMAWDSIQKPGFAGEHMSEERHLVETKLKTYLNAAANLKASPPPASDSNAKVPVAANAAECIDGVCSLPEPTSGAGQPDGSTSAACDTLLNKL